MAKYEHLPIYKQAMELVVFIENAVKGFSRYHKYSIGERLRQASWEVITLIVQANNVPVKARKPLLVTLRDKIEEVNIALNVAKELKSFANHNSYRQVSRMAIDISRQAAITNFTAKMQCGLIKILV